MASTETSHQDRASYLSDRGEKYGGEKYGDIREAAGIVTEIAADLRRLQHSCSAASPKATEVIASWDEISASFGTLHHYSTSIGSQIVSCIDENTSDVPLNLEDDSTSKDSKQSDIDELIQIMQPFQDTARDATDRFKSLKRNQVEFTKRLTELKGAVSAWKELSCASTEVHWADYSQSSYPGVQFCLWGGSDTAIPGLDLTDKWLAGE